MEIPKEEETLEELREGSKVEEPKLLSKMLYQHLKYVFLEENGDKPIIMSTSLSISEEKKLFEVLKANWEAIRWSISNVKGISPS